MKLNLKTKLSDFARITVYVISIFGVCLHGLAQSSYIAPERNWVLPGGDLQVEVRIDSGSSPLGAYDLKIEYDPSFLEAVSISAGESQEFGAPLSQNMATPGRILVNDLQTQSIDGPTGDIHVLNVDFHALDQLGETSITLNTRTLVDTEGNLIAADSNGATVTITDNVPEPSPTPIWERDAYEYVVTSLDDTSDEGTLRWAIENANNDGNGSLIRFSSDLDGETIRIIHALPSLTEPMTTINGDHDSDGIPNIQLLVDYGSEESISGISVDSSDNIIRGISIGGFAAGEGFLISIHASRNQIKGCFVGIDLEGNSYLNNEFQLGVSLEPGATECVIGGVDLLDRNIISGNGTGINVHNAPDNQILGNYVGTDSSGTEAVANVSSGILIVESDDVIIGGDAIGAGNLIANNQIHVHNSSNLLVEQNVFGVDVNEIKPMPSPDWSIWCIGVTDSVIRNNLFGNSKRYANSGINIGGVGLGGGARNLVVDNIVGSSRDGLLEWGNTGDGISIGQESGTVVRNNRIRYHARYGIHIDRVVDAVVEGNLIEKNDSYGIAIEQSNGNFIDNAVTDNRGGGIFIGQDSHECHILQSDIKRNGRYGILITTTAGSRIEISQCSITGHSREGIRDTRRGADKIAPPEFLSVNEMSILGVAEVADGSVVEVFSDPEDEGEVFLGETQVSRGLFSFNAAVPTTGFITATVTNLNGNTSMFSNPVEYPYSSGITPTVLPETPTSTPVPITPSPTATELIEPGVTKVVLRSEQAEVNSEEIWDVDVRIQSLAEPIGAYDFEIQYPADMLHVEEVLGGENPEFGAPTGVNTSTPGKIIVNDFQAQTLEGPLGNIHVLTLRFAPIVNSGTGTLEVDVRAILNTAGNLLEVVTEELAFSVSGSPVVTPSDTPTPTLTPTPTDTATFTPTPTPTFESVQTPTPGVGLSVQLSPDVNMYLAWIPGGEFQMGSPDHESGRRDDEGPVHSVTISEGFWMGLTEVTQAQYAAVLGESPSGFEGVDLPVENVNWDNAVAFCESASEQTGFDFQLPTEAQWEYAARAGSSTRFYFGDADDCSDNACNLCMLDEYAWYCGNAERQTHPAGEKVPNAFGLFDMIGNVWEWCADTYKKDFYAESPIIDPVNLQNSAVKIMRGGAWTREPKWLRSAGRGGQSRNFRRDDIGFRVIITLQSLATPTPTLTPSPTPEPEITNLFMLHFHPKDLQEKVTIGPVTGYELAELSIGNVPAMKGSDGNGLIVTAQPGQGAAVFSNLAVDLKGAKAVITLAFGANASGAQVVLAGLNYPVDGQMIYTNPIGDAIPTDELRELELIYDPPAGVVLPFLQVVVPHDAPGPVTIYLDRLSIGRMPYEPNYKGTLPLVPDGSFEGDNSDLIQNIGGADGQVEIVQVNNDSAVSLSIEPANLAANMALIGITDTPPHRVMAEASVQVAQGSGGTNAIMLTNGYESVVLVTSNDALEAGESKLRFGSRIDYNGPSPLLLLVQNAGPGVSSTLEVDDCVIGLLKPGKEPEPVDTATPTHTPPPTPTPTITPMSTATNTPDPSIPTLTPVPTLQTLMLLNFNAEDFENGLYVTGPIEGFGQADVSTGTIPQGLDSDGFGLVITADPGEGVVLFPAADVPMEGNTAFLRILGGADTTGAQIALVGLNSPVDGQLAYSNPVGEAIPIDQLREISVIYDPPSGNVFPYLQVVVPYDAQATVHVYLDRLSVEALPLSQTTDSSIPLASNGNFDDGLTGVIQNVGGADGQVRLSSDSGDNSVRLTIRNNNTAANIALLEAGATLPDILQAEAVVRPVSGNEGTTILMLTNGLETLSLFRFNNLIDSQGETLQVGGYLEATAEQPFVFIIQNSGPNVRSTINVDDAELKSVNLTR